MIQYLKFQSSPVRNNNVFTYVLKYMQTYPNNVDQEKIISFLFGVLKIQGTASNPFGTLWREFLSLYSWNSFRIWELLSKIDILVRF